MKARKIFTLLTFLILSASSLFSQSYLIPVDAPTNKYPITFTDAGQKILVLTFTKPVTPGANISQIGWSVTGTAATIFRIDAVASSVQITLNSSITFAERATVKVTYSAAAGSFSMADLTEPDFLNVSAVNNSYPTQTDFSNGLYGEIAPTDICAPVLSVDVTSNVIIAPRYRNSIYFRTPRMTTLWMYPALVPKTEPDYAETGGVGTGIFSKTNTNANYPDNTINCTWVISIYPYVPAQAPAPSLAVTDRQVFITIPNYKLDNGTPAPGTGSLALNPPVDDPTTLFCVGKDITAFTFTDATVFDCQFPLPEANLPNTRDRNVQYVYGTQTGAGIPNVYIKVGATMVQVTDGSGNSISGIWHTNPDGTFNAVGYTTPSGFFEGPVVTYLWDAGTKLRITPLITTYPIYHTGDFVNDLAGDIFDVSLRNWGPCNPYDAMDPFTYLQAVTKFSRLRLILSPPLPTAASPTYCFGAVNPNLTATGTTGTLKWYTDAALTAQVGVGGSFAHGKSAVGTYNFWVNETLGTGCAGPARPVVLTITASPTATAGGTQTICQNGTATVSGASSTNGTILWTENGAGSITAGATTLTPTYTAAAGDAGSTVTLTMTVSNPPCSDAIATYSVIVQALPTATAGGTQTICQNGTAVVGGAAATNGTIAWTENGAGSITSGATTLTPTYTAAAGDAGNTVTLTMTVTSNNTCTPATATATYTVLVKATPTATAGGTQTICQNGTATVSGATSSNGTIAWTENGAGSITAGATTLTPTYTAAAGDAGNTVTLTMTVSNAPCTAATATYTVIVEKLPTATAGGTQTICQNGTATVGGAAATNGTIAWTENGAGSITSGATTLTPTYTAAAGDAGTTVTLTMTVTSNNTCTPATATATYTVIVKATPTATAGGTQTICQNGTATVSGAASTNGTIAWTENGAGSITAGATTLTPTYTAAAGDAGTTVTLTMTVSNAPCTAATATYTVIVEKLPTATAGGTQTICQNGTATVGGAAATNGTIAWTENGAGSITSGATTLTPTYTAAAGDAGTTVTLTMTVTSNNTCTPATATATYTVIVKGTPTASAGGTKTICQNGTATVSGASSTNGTIAWTEDGAGSITSGATTLTPTYTAAAGDAGNTVTLTMTVSNAPCTAATATYTVIVEKLPTATAGGTQTICQNGTATVGGAAATNGTIAWTENGAGSITSGATTLTPTYTAAAGDAGTTVTLTMTVTSNNTCTPATATATYTVIVKGTPTATAGGTQTICQNGTATVSGATSSNGTIAWTEDGAGSITSGATTLTPTYTAAAGDAGNTVTLTMTVSNAPCAAATATYTVLVKATPTASAGGSQTICQNGTATVSGASSTNGAIAWTENGVGSITSGATTLTPTYTAAAGDAGNTVTLTMTVSNAPCTSATATYTVIVQKLPTATAGGTQTICQNGTATVSGATATNGTIAWTENGAGSITAGATTLTPTYTAAAGDAGTTVTLTMTVTSNNNCAPATATATYSVVVQPLPTATAGGTKTICQNGTATVSGATAANGTILWTENGAGSITGGATTLTPTYTAAAGDAGTTVTLTMTVTSNNTCVPATATATYSVIVDPLPTATAGGSQTICQNGAAIVSGASATNGTILWTENGFGSITAGATTLTPTYTSVAGDAGSTVTLTMTVTSNNTCTPITASAIYSVTVNPSAPAAAPAYVSGASSICKDGTLNIDVTDVATADTYIWDYSWIAGTNNATTAVSQATIPLTGLAPGVYTVDVQGKNGCGPGPWMGAFTFTIYAIPVANAGLTQSICNAKVATLAAVPSVGTGTWTKFSGPGTVTFGPDANTPGATATVSLYGSYVLRWTELNGVCSSSNDVVITYNQQPSITAPADKEVCNTKTSAIVATDLTYEAGSGHLESYLWTKLTGPGTAVFTPNNALSTSVTVSLYGVYTFQITGTNGAGCTSNDVIQVTFDQRPSVTAPADIEVCNTKTSAIVATDLTYEAGSGHSESYLWTKLTGPGTAVFTPNNALSTSVTVSLYGVYTFQITGTNGAGCTSSDVIQVTFDQQPSITAPADIEVCNTKTSAIVATDLTYEAGSGHSETYLWTKLTGPGTAAFTPNNALSTSVTVSLYGVYTFQITGTNGAGCSSNDVIQVTFDQRPSVTAPADKEVCNTKTSAIVATDLTYEAGSGHSESYLWTKLTGPGAAVFTPNNALSTSVTVSLYGVYTFQITGTNGAGCSSNDVIQVTFDQRPSVTAPADIEVCNTKTSAIVATDLTYEAGSGHSETYLWTKLTGPGTAAFTPNNALSTSVTVSLYGVYTFQITGTNGAGCTSNDVIQITFDQQPSVTAPADKEVCNTKTSAIVATDLTYEAGSGHSETYLWTKLTGPGTAAFTPNNALSTSVTVSLYGVYTFQITGTNGAGCSSNDVIQVTFDQRPSVTAPADIEVCNTKTSAIVATDLTYEAGSGHSETYLWTKLTGPGTAVFTPNNALSTSVTVSLYGVYTFQITGTNGAGCSSNDVIQVTFDQRPSVTAPADIEVCNTKTSAIVATDLTYEAGSGHSETYLWTKLTGPGTAAFTPNNALSTSVTVSLYGVYTFQITGTNGAGCTSNDVIQITFDQQPSVTAPADKEVCNTKTSAIVATDLTYEAGSGHSETYLWTKLTGPGTAAFTPNNALSTSVTVSLYGVYTFQITGTNGAGCSSNDVIQVTFDQRPSVTAPADIEVCNTKTSAIVATDLTYEAGSGHSETYLWTKLTGPGTAAFTPNNALSTSVTVSLYGIYTFQITGTNGAGCTSNDVIQVTFDQQPSVTAPADKEVCNTKTSAIVATDTYEAGSGHAETYLWTKLTGPGTAVFTPNNALSTSVTVSLYGVYTFQITGTNGAGCTSIDVIQVTFDQRPSVTAPADIEVCNTKTSAIVATDTYEAGSGHSETYLWTKLTGPGTAAFTPNNALSTSVTVSLYGIYTFQITGTNGAGCTSNDVIQITFDQQPSVTAPADKEVCNTKTSAIVATDTYEAGSGHSETYLWTKLTGPGTAAFTPNNALSTSVTVSLYGVYTFQITGTNGAGCTSNDVIQVTFDQQPSVTAPADKEICNSKISAIVATDTYEAGSGHLETYLWTKLTGPGTAVFTPNNALSTSVTVSLYGVYTFQITGTNGAGCTSNDVIQVTFDQQPSVTAPADKEVCNTKTSAIVGTDLTYEAGSGHSETYLWTKLTGPGTAAFTPNNALSTSVTVSLYGVYTFQITGTNGAGCTSNDVIQVTFDQQPSVIAPADKEVCNTKTSAIVATDTYEAGSGHSETYLWTKLTGPGTAVFTPNNALSTSVTVSLYGVYTFQITGTNGAGCTSNDVIQVTFDQQPSVTAPADKEVCNTKISAIVATDLTYEVGSGHSESYLWTQLTGPGTAVFTPNNALSTSVTVSLYGVYTFQITGTNGAGCTSNDVIQVTFDQQPSVTAPADKEVCSTKTSAIVATDTYEAGSGHSETYLWTKLTGPGTAVFTPNSALSTSVTVSLYGVYTFQITGTNGAGCTSNDVIQVTLDQRPSVAAPADIEVCNSKTSAIVATDLTYEAGSGHSESYLWTKLTGPGTAVFTPNNALSTSVTVSDYGVYTFQITGTNGAGCTSNDVIQVTYYEKPVANAGTGGTVCGTFSFGLAASPFIYAAAPNQNWGTKTWSMTGSPAGATVTSWGAGAGNAVTTVTIDKYGTYQFTWTEINGTCNDAQTISVTFNEGPLLTIGLAQTVCSSVASSLSLSIINTVPGTTYQWSAPVNTGGMTGGTAGLPGSAGPITDIFTNKTGAPQTATYSVIPTSLAGCSGPARDVVITVNPEPVAPVITGLDKLCTTDPGNHPYTVVLNPLSSSFAWTVDPAVGTKTFDVNSNAILVTAAALAGSGNITVTEKNIYNCFSAPGSFPVQVLAPPAIEAITGPAIVCANSTQVYSVTSRVGSTYSWNLPSGAAIVGDPTANSITVIFANFGGTISVRETNSAGCFTNHTPKGITVNPLPTATISGGGTICQGGSTNLSVDFTGTGPYFFTYAIDGISQPPVATAADPYSLPVTAAGTYTIVNVSDVNCTNIGTGSTIVSFYPKPTAIISGSGEMCLGGTKTLTISLTGFAPYTFTYTDGTTPVTVTGHPTNVYTVDVSPAVNTTYLLLTLTDGHSCDGAVFGTAVITINNPPALTLAGTNLICYGSATGAVDMTVTGGTSPFGISWTGPSGFTATSEDISSLAAGYYAVVVMDSKGCTANANITVTQPPVLTGSAAGTNITCFGANDGTITISGAAGGSGSLEFTIGGAWQAAPVFTLLTPGTYNVRMRDAVNPTCILTLNGALLLTQPAVLNATITKTDASCFGASNGSIVITAPTGGYGTYGYSVDGGTNWSGSGNFAGLPAGTYDVRIRDAANMGCVVTLNGALVISQPPVLSATLASTNVTCAGANDGTITISSPLGGHGTYEYSINGGGSWQPTGTYTSLAPGTHNVQIHDAAATGCFVVLNAALTITQPPILSASVATTNVSCNGANDGIIDITAPAGGYGTYQYSVTGGSTWQATGLFTGLAPVSYDVRIKDAAYPGCFIILNPGLLITQPAVLSATVTTTDITCFGANDGIIQISGSTGGYGTYQYSIDGGVNYVDPAVFSGLAPGTYDVRIRDKAHTGCFKILNATTVITSPAVLNATANSAAVTCNGASDGTITFSSPSGGYGSYGYSITGGTSWQASANFTNLAPGTYNLRIRDAANTLCIMPVLPAIVITEPAALTASIVKTDVTCYNAANGSIIINAAAGGYGTYEYSINGGSGWQPSNSFTALTPGFYNVKIRDLANPTCVVTLNGSLNISQPPVLNANVSKTNVTCNGANNGSITITSPSGGYGTYEYSVDAGATWHGSGSFTGLAPASYNVQIQDAAHAGCFIVLNPALVITQPAALSATVTSTDVSCFGANNGIITITGAAGGYGTYEYSVNGGTTWVGLGNFTNLAPATYDVRIHDVAYPLCELVLNGALVITQPAALSATVAKTDITCFGAGDGTITVSAPAGGYGTYEYSINGGGSWQVSGSFTAVGPGTYNVQMRDGAHGSCIKVLNNSLSITQPAIINAVITSTSVTCNGANDGIINVTGPTGGFGLYEYSKDGGINWVPSGLFTGLIPATYDVRIRDAAHIGCVTQLNGALVITEPAVLSANVNSANISCFGANNGTITISSPAGGYGTYEYSDDGGLNWQATGNFINLLPATYNVQIRDKAHTGCVKILPPVTITEPAVLNATVNSTAVTCFGANNGTITISAPAGGYGTYSYTINGGGSWQSSGSFTNLAPGTYVVKIRDAVNASCIIVLDPGLVITQPAVLNAAVAKTNVSCFGTGDGTITITAPTGGYGTYDYSVDGGSTWQPSGNFISLLPGFYNVQIRDAANTACVIVLNSSLQITQPAVLTANIATTNVTCNGANDGTITITSPSGGYGTYEYSKDGITWQPSGSFTALAPASYNVQIRDAAHTGCFIILNPALLITQPAVLNATVANTNVTCFGANDGTITITSPAGGYGTYQYSKDGGLNWQGSGIFTNLAPAVYDVRMRDASQTACEKILNSTLAVTQPPVLSATVAKTNVSCYGGSDGTITITAPLGGYGTYDYSINGGGSWQPSGNFTALVPGNYNVQIRDAAHLGCVIVLNSSLPITQPSVLNAVITTTNVTCNSANDGIINITAPTGGSGAYEYSKDGGSTWQVSGLFGGLAPSTYNIQIHDAANPACIIVLNSSVVITEPAALNASVASADVTCNGAHDGSITVSFATGGYGTFEFSDDGGANWQATGSFINLTPSTYNVQIRDKAHTGCVKILNAGLVITEPAVLNATVAATDVSCFGANNGTITISSPTGGYGTYSYSINGGSTWQPAGTFTNLAPATYNVKMRDAANLGCQVTLNGALVITQPAVLNALVASTNVTCFGSGNGTITITSPSGGYGTYEYSVNGGTTWQASGSFTALIPGFYNVQIHDAANPSCVIILNGSLQITQPSVLSAFVSKSDVTCNGGSDGTITIGGASGGYGTYEYSDDGGANWQATGNFTGLLPASYNVQIRDAAHTGCVKVIDAALLISQPAVLSATVTPTMATCNGANDGMIAITGPAGGYGTYQYSVNGGISWQGSGTFTNLAAPANYDVRIKDAANPTCFVILNPALAITQPAVLTATIASTNVSCFGGNDGTITISSPSGGYGTYEYSINGGGSWQASGIFTALSTGSYNILVRDGAHNGCVKVLNNAYGITQPGMLTATVGKTDVSCKGDNDGKITITAPSGGYGTYEYSDDGGVNWQSSGSFTNLAPATYDVRIRDAAHISCSVILYPNLVITEPILLAMTSTGDITLNCFGDGTGFGSFYASGGTMPYSFSVVSNTTGATLAGPGFNSQSFFSGGAGSITVAVIDFHGCFAQATINITQPALLTPGSVGADQILCSGDNPAQLTEVLPATGGPGAYSYQWQYSSAVTGPFINIAGALSFQYTPVGGATNTLYYRRMVTSGVCTPVYSNPVEVKVNPKPVAILSGGETICPGQTSILKVNMMVGTGPYELNIQGLGVITGYVTGTDIPVTPAVTTNYTLISAKDANSCIVTAPSANLIGSALVTVRSLPAITTSPADKTSCEFGLVTFSVAATGSDLTYQWFVNTGTGFNPVADGGVYFGATNSTLSLFGVTRLMTGYVYHAVVSGCSASVTSADATLTVNTVPEIITQPKDSTICLGANGAFSVSGAGTGVAYQWQVNKGLGFVNVVNDANFGGSGSNTLTITAAPGTFNNYIMRVILTGTCGVPVYSNFAVLRVNIPPAISLNPVNKAICDGTGPVFFTAGGTGLIDSLRWQVFSGGTWSDIHDNATYSGSASQQLTLFNVPIGLNGNQYRLALKAKCAIITSTGATLTVHANPVVNFSAVDPIHACGEVPLVINGNPAGGSGTWSTHLWTGDIGPLNNYFIQSPSFNSQIAGTYNLNYKVKDSNGCYGNDDVTVIVDAPDAGFTQDKNTGCTPETVTFTKNMAGVAKFWWDFGDGSPKDSVTVNPSHQFTNASPSSIVYRNVKLTVKSPGGCFDTFTSSVTVYPAINATFSVTPSIVCSGKTIVMTAATPGASKYFWDYGDGVSEYSATETTNHIYTNTTTAPVVRTVTLTTTSFYNCSDVKTKTITVMPVPQPQFTAFPVSQIYDPAGNPVTFTNTTNAGTWTYSWKFADGGTSTLQNPVHNYTALGTYNVVLTVSNANCSDSVRHPVSVVPIPPVADFEKIPDGCQPVSFTINNTSLNTATPGTIFNWDFGDGTHSNTKNPAHNYADPGVYIVTLDINGPGGSSSKTQTVHVYATPIASFEITPTTVFVNDEKVRAFNLSQGADYWVWEWGDGDTSKTKDPFHKYMVSGTYDVTLSAFRDNGGGNICYDRYVLSPGVTVEPAGEIRFATVFTPNLTGEVDHPTTATMDQFFYPPLQEQVTDYKLQIFNRLGVLIFESHNLNDAWNGYYHHKLCPQGVYVWYVEGKYKNNQPFKKVGDITLLH